MKNFIAITICFAVGLIMCQQSSGQQAPQPEKLVLKTSECAQDCGDCCETPVRNAVKSMLGGVDKIGCRVTGMAKNTMCKSKKVLGGALSHTKCVTKRMASRARSFTKRVFSRPCCN